MLISKDETILDCVYNDFLRTYFVIDCLCWKSHPILETEVEKKEAFLIIF